MTLCVSLCVSVTIPPAADGGASRLLCGGPNGQAGASALGGWAWSLRISLPTPSITTTTAHSRADPLQCLN